jgi:CBS domain-containing protein
MLVKDALQNQLMCTPDANLEDVVQIMNQNDCYIIPVVESLIHKNPIGVVTEKSICRRSIAKGLNPLKLNAGRVMNCDYKTISPDANLGRCRDAMRAANVRYLVVVDENNVCRGLIAKDEVERLLNQPRVFFTHNKIPLQTKTISYYDRIF